jgi:hypothetical protein
VFSGIVPIYYGAPDVLSLFQGFNASGILLFSSIAQLESILQHVVSESDYNSRVDALRQNAALFKKLMGRGVVSRLKNLFL